MSIIHRSSRSPDSRDLIKSVDIYVRIDNLIGVSDALENFVLSENDKGNRFTKKIILVASLSI